MSKRRILIVGGGAGGLELATRLGREAKKRARNGGEFEVLLVDARPAHFWKPLLHQVASGALDSHLDEIGFLEQSLRNGFRYQFGAMTGLDKERQEVILAAIRDPETGEELFAERRERYDDLVIAVGSQVNDFGVPGVAEHCQFLDNREQAYRLRQRLLLCMGQAQAAQEHKRVRVVIVGAGATGVELAAEIVHTTEVVNLYGREDEQVVLDMKILETGPRILPGVADEVAQETADALAALKVEVRTGSEVVEVRASEVVTGDGETLPADIVVWAAGVAGPPFLAELGLPTGKGNRLKIDSHLRVQGEERIFAIGDCSLCEADRDGKPVPARAQAASQQAEHLAALLAQPPGGRMPSPFRYKDRGTLVSLADFTAFGQIGRKDSNTISGKLALVAYNSLRRQHQATLLGIPRTGALIVSDWLRRSTAPPLKLT